MRSVGRRTSAAVIACLVIVSLSATAEAEQLQPVPVTPAEPVLPLGPPAITEAEPSIGSPVSSVQAVSIHLTSGQLTKTVTSAKSVSVPIGQGVIEAVVHFPVAVDGRATSVTLQQTQQTAGDGSWRVERRDPPAPDQVAFVLRGTDVADLVVQLQPPLGATPVRFALRITPSTVITAADAGGVVELERGERFSLELADGYTWTVTVGDETIVRRTQDDPAVFEALQPGSTDLLISGDPACYGSSRAGCLAPSLILEIGLVVI